MKGLVLALIAAACAASLYLLNGAPGTQASPASARQGVTRPAPGEPLVPLHGVAIQIHRAEEAAERIAPLIREIAGLGANSVTLSLSGYQKHAGSWRIANDPNRTPTAKDVGRLIDAARAAGLRVIVMPKILLSEPRGSEWRGRIQPPSWDDWFDQYRRFIVEWARVAEEGKADVFVVGSELVTTEKHTEQWLRVIRDVRLVFHGQIAYSANWDHYSGIEFWPKVDLIGLTSYHKLSDKQMPEVADLVAAWRPIKRKILEWQERQGKPLLFTEVGWASQPGCSIEAWNYYRHTKPSDEGLEEQRRCYEAFTAVWAETPQLAGTIWWEWTDQPGGSIDFSYTPKAKPAEQVLRKWFELQAAGGAHPAP
jgi:hypothetical protein